MARIHDLREFQHEISRRMPSPTSRPFVCSGSPLECTSFIVGINAATNLPRPFSAYWSDKTGFDRAAFDADYLATRQMRGNRPVIEALSREIGDCLETNLYSEPTRKLRDLAHSGRVTAVFEFLFDALRPKFIFAHGKAPIAFLRAVAEKVESDESMELMRWQGHDFWLYGRPGPLYTLGARRAAELGRELTARMRKTRLPE
jgi:hypothetical protein